MYPVQVGDLLFRVVRYELWRSNKELIIEVFHCLSGADAGTFQTALFCDGAELSKSFLATGKTEVEALRNCLLNLQDLSLEQILHRDQWVPPLDR